MDTDQLRSHFDRHAGDFDRLYHPGRQSPFERWLNRRFRSDIAGRYVAALEHVHKSGAKSVLDVGCGPGHYLAALAEMGIPRIVGVDVSEAMIKLARENPGVAGAASVELVCCDYLAWDSAEKFDVVLAMGFFDYVSNPVVYFKRMREQVRLSLCASFPSRHWMRTPIRLIRRRLQGTRVYFYDSDRIGQLSVNGGFARCVTNRLPGAGMNLLGEFFAS
jgi:2-polyprenyl-3-methyl-5-hydroxy-6-metoxy-1,4-benzoquinol methylase